MFLVMGRGERTSGGEECVGARREVSGRVRRETQGATRRGRFQEFGAARRDRADAQGPGRGQKTGRAEVAANGR